MRFKKLEKPVINGCLNCGKIPNKILQLSNEVLYNNIYIIRMYINDNEYFNYVNTENMITISDIVKKYNKDIQLCDSFCIEIKNPLTGEIYELDKQDNTFYLINQVEGWA